MQIGMRVSKASLACKASLFFFYYSQEDMSTAGGGVVLRAVPTSQHMPSQDQPYSPNRD